MMHNTILHPFRAMFDKMVAQCTPQYTRLHLEDAYTSLNRLEQLTREIEHRDSMIRMREHDIQHLEQLIRNVTDNVEDSIWAKDIDNNFVFVNQACCDKILRCAMDDVFSMTDADFEKDSIAKACTVSDEITKKSMRTCRFIESAIYDDGCSWFDVLKSPWFSKGQIIGTVGTARDITYLVPTDLECECKTIEIPIDWKYSDVAIRELCAQTE